MWTERRPDRFIVGVNLPWVGYGTDIGASNWFPDGGLSAQPDVLQRLDTTFETLARDGITIVRIFVLCDARSGVRFDADGMPLGVDDAVWRDVDALLASARRHGVRVMPVLFDLLLCRAVEIVDGVQLGGRAHLIADERASSALIDRVIAPLVERYRDDEAIVAWDVINEPEWCINASARLRLARIPFEAMQRFLRASVDCIKGTASQPVTIGCAGTWRLDLVRPLGLDFYQIHWYERFGWAALTRPLEELGLADRPAILGEFSGRSTRIGEVLDAARRAGYEGALAWSVLADDDQSAYPAGLSEWMTT
jgi:hypothetical protein